MGYRKQICDTRPSVSLDENSGNKEFIFPSTHFTTDLLEEGPISNKILAIQMIEEYVELNKKTKELD